MRMQFALFSLFVTLVASRLPADASADFEGEQQIQAAAKALLPYFSAQPPEGLENRFNPSFLKVIDANQMQKILRSHFDNHGRAVEVRFIRMTRPFAAEVEFVFEKDARVPTTIIVDGKPPYRISGIFFKHPLKDNDTFTEIGKELAELPGTVAYRLVRLDDKPKVLGERLSDKPLAVASGCKLTILAALLDEIGQGKRDWKDLVVLRKDLGVPLSGLLADWPAGAPATVHTLATLMIARSDNTAADHLIDLLGREKIENMETLLGVKSVNRPFLTIGEALKIKWVLTAREQKDFAAADEATRRKLLSSVVKEASLKAARPLGEPTLIDRVEWFYSAADMCRIMDWHRTAKPAAGREILAVNSGLVLDETFWTYVGYKGGAEPGVLSITLLLKAKTDAWFAFSIIWNNPDGDVDLTQLNGIAHRLLRLAQKSR